MDLDVVFLSRVQFAFTIMFHYLFPPLSIGLGWIMVLTEGLYLKTRDPQYEAITRFLTKLFAVNFAMGVATGIVMEFEFGTNWATYSRFVGDVFGSALAAEGIFAFFLESGFLAVWFSGGTASRPRCTSSRPSWSRSGPSSRPSGSWWPTRGSRRLRAFTSWARGCTARAEITDFWAMVFNPSSVNRLSHVLVGAVILAGFFVMSIAAYYILKKRHLDAAKKMFDAGLAFALVGAIAAPLTGHMQATTVAETQPAKLAAFEGLYATQEASALSLFGIPNNETGEVDYEVAVPGLLSFMIHGDFTTPVTGLDQVAPEDRPPMHVPFYTYHIMIGLGMFFLALTTVAASCAGAGRSSRSAG